MNCMACGSTNDVTDFVSGGEKIILCVDCRYKLATGQLNVKQIGQIGRPPIGITKKVSLTLSESAWERVERRAEGNRSEYLRKLVERDVWGQEAWSNNACLGYAILGAKRLGYSEEQTEKLIRAIYSMFDETSIEEARELYERSPY